MWMGYRVSESESQRETPLQPTKVHGPENHVASNLAGLGICCAAVSACAENVRASHKLRKGLNGVGVNLNCGWR